MGIFNFGNNTNNLHKMADSVVALDAKYSAMSLDDLKSQTKVLRTRLDKGETLDDILTDAFAVCREMSWRVLHKKQYPVQIMGGIVLHQGKVAEMCTGEGKTLMEVLPAYLNALGEDSVHIVTVNEYLAERDYNEMKGIFQGLGLSVALVLEKMTLEQKKKAYSSKVVYCTNSAIGFDHLRDNVAKDVESKVQGEFGYAIVDEIDSILLDDARTPLILAGADDMKANLKDDMYVIADCVRGMTKRVSQDLEKWEMIDEDTDGAEVDYDYIVLEKTRTAVMTERGYKKLEKYLGIHDIFSPMNQELLNAANNIVKAFGIMKNGRDYIVKNGKVELVDISTGRVMDGRRFTKGLHQAIEAKEKVEINPENKTFASITYQSLFNKYHKLSGMSGTVYTSLEEFNEIYNLDIVKIPTNKPIARIDEPDEIYSTLQAKYDAIVREVKAAHDREQPVLIGTASISDSETLSKIFLRNRIPHKVLNAKHHKEEAEIIANAGNPGAVTISTNMAGRGTDIKLGGNEFYDIREKLESEQIIDNLINTEVAKYGLSDKLNPDVLKACKASLKSATYQFLQDTEGEYNVGVYGVASKNPIETILTTLYKNSSQEYKKIQHDIAPYRQSKKDKVLKSGGLYVIGTERHESARVDNQLRGRAGRQGDPGRSKFIISLEDSILNRSLVTKLIDTIPESLKESTEPLPLRTFGKKIDKIQKNIESTQFEGRRKSLAMDCVLDGQRQSIYEQRDRVLKATDEELLDFYKNMAYELVRSIVEKTDGDPEAFYKAISSWLLESDDFSKEAASTSEDCLEPMDMEQTIDLLNSRVDKLASITRLRADKVTPIDVRLHNLRAIMLKSIDTSWVTHLSVLEDIKEGIGLLQYAQKDPVVEYRLQAADAYDNLIEQITNRIALRGAATLR